MAQCCPSRETVKRREVAVRCSTGGAGQVMAVSFMTTACVEKEKEGLLGGGRALLLLVEEEEEEEVEEVAVKK